MSVGCFFVTLLGHKRGYIWLLFENQRCVVVFVVVVVVVAVAVAVAVVVVVVVVVVGYGSTCSVLTSTTCVTLANLKTDSKYIDASIGGSFLRPISIGVVPFFTLKGGPYQFRTPVNPLLEIKHFLEAGFYEMD